jgi:hypothetical protein
MPQDGNERIGMTGKYLREQANRCRELAKRTTDDGVARVLRQMADEYDDKARAAGQEDKAG